MTVFYPGFKLVNPLPYHINNGLVFPLARDDVWRRYVNKWIDFRSQDGTFTHLYNQWILGQEYKKEHATWSIYNNVIKPKWETMKDKSSLKTEDIN